MSRKVRRFTRQAKRALYQAEEEAERFQHHYIGNEHILLALMDEADSVAAQALANIGLDRARCEAFIQQAGPSGRWLWWRKFDLTRDVRRMLEIAVIEARRRDQRYVGTEHLLLGLARYTKGRHAEILKDAGIEGETIRQAVEQVLQQPPTKTEAEPTIQQMFTTMPGAAEAQGRSVRLVLKGADETTKAELQIPLSQLQLLLLQGYQGRTGQVGRWKHGDDLIDAWVE